MSTVIKVENLSKQYRLGLVGASTFKEDAQRWWAKMRGKEDPFLQLGVENDRTISDEAKFVWSLKDINFEVLQGDVLGVIGRNGAGKSTLLKILSKVTAPTTGTVKVKGRIASLLEVGTGFHPDLTGRENIYLNGAILGMRKHEITRKLDEIIAFAGIEKYVDTPVKRYSSGMYVRLAFAVAAHLESEILIIDEVLAVGDAEFQKKCLGKIDEVSSAQGRSVIFVSHNLSMFKKLCTNGIILEKGKLKYNGDIESAIEKYISNGIIKKSYFISDLLNINDFTTIELFNEKNIKTGFFNHDQEISINFKFNLDKNISNKVFVGFRVIDQQERIVFTINKPVISFIPDKHSNYNIKATIPKSLLVPNSYKLTFALHIPNIEVISLLEDVVSFTILETGSASDIYSNLDNGCVFVDCLWGDSNSINSF
jgi:lipopolysaccharide transport system ATP-binding protein